MKFKQYTTENKVFKSISKDPIIDPTETLKKLENERDKCKHKAFGKVTYRPHKVDSKETQNLFDQKKKMLESKSESSQKKEKYIKLLDS